MADQIKIKNLEVTSYRGADQTETGQRLLVDVVFYTDTREAGQSDEMARSVDYDAACCFIAEYVKKHPRKLLESVAEHLAEEILLEIPQVDRVDIEIKKPWPSDRYAAESVSAAISRAWHTVELSIGSNEGDRRRFLINAVRSVESNPKNRRVKRSGMIESRPYGYADQPAFLNAAVEIQTLYTPRELLGYIHELEGEAGRVHDTDRLTCPLDLDIVFYDDLVMGESDLVIPHPDMQNRMYILGPLSELCPGKLHPVFNKSVMRMRRELEHRQEGQDRR